MTPLSLQLIKMQEQTDIYSMGHDKCRPRRPLHFSQSMLTVDVDDTTLFQLCKPDQFHSNIRYHSNYWLSLVKLMLSKLNPLPPTHSHPHPKHKSPPRHSTLPGTQHTKATSITANRSAPYQTQIVLFLYHIINHPIQGPSWMYPAALCFHLSG